MFINPFGRNSRFLRYLGAFNEWPKSLRRLHLPIATLIRYVTLSILMPRGKKKGLSTKKFDRCVSKVKSRSGKKANPYAVCNASMGGKTKHKRK